MDTHSKNVARKNDSVLPIFEKVGETPIEVSVPGFGTASMMHYSNDEISILVQEYADMPNFILLTERAWAKCPDAPVDACPTGQELWCTGPHPHNTDPASGAVTRTKCVALNSIPVSDADAWSLCRCPNPPSGYCPPGFVVYCTGPHPHNASTRFMCRPQKDDADDGAETERN